MCFITGFKYFNFFHLFRTFLSLSWLFQAFPGFSAGKGVCYKGTINTVASRKLFSIAITYFNLVSSKFLIARSVSMLIPKKKNPNNFSGFISLYFYAQILCHLATGRHHFVFILKIMLMPMQTNIDCMLIVIN